jgi:hypothetical protein
MFGPILCLTKEIGLRQIDQLVATSVDHCFDHEYAEAVCLFQNEA